MRDVLRFAETPSPRRGRNAALTRLSGLVLYTAAVLWCAYTMPQTIPFVVPAAVLGGGLLHVWKKRPVLGMLVFVLIVVGGPLLIAPSLLTGTYLDLTDWL